VTAHPIVERAALGELPPWAEASESRRAHMARVAALMGSWSEELALPMPERVRWVAVAWLHDALRDADPDTLRSRVPPAMAALPGPLLHGPAVAERLRLDGVADGEILGALAYHTLGHPELGTLGQALYAADFLEPGRDLLNDWRATLRARMPEELTDVVRELLAARIVHLVERGSAMRPETVAFWNSLAVEE
jgi:2-amino-4-hydroxy-6-hydroxymethyldihydropteridine diphosphokinase